MILSILIATVKERETIFNELLEEFERQLSEHDLHDKVQICYMQDNKEISIGHKRNILLDMAEGDYIVFFDDDDWPMEYYIPIIVQKLEEHQPDCLGYKIKMTTNGKDEVICEHSLKHAKLGWQTMKSGPIKYLRNVTHFNVVKKRLANMIRFNNLRFGEDKIYSDKLTQICKKEIYIDVPYMFEYRYSNAVSHNKKYGIK